MPGSAPASQGRLRPALTAEAALRGGSTGDRRGWKHAPGSSGSYRGRVGPRVRSGPPLQVPRVCSRPALPRLSFGFGACAVPGTCCPAPTEGAPRRATPAPSSPFRILRLRSTPRRARLPQARARARGGAARRVRDGSPLRVWVRTRSRLSLQRAPVRVQQGALSGALLPRLSARPREMEPRGCGPEAGVWTTVFPSR